MNFRKNDRLKPRLDLVPPLALELIGWVLRSGAIKYADENWRQCDDPQKYIAAALRHLNRALSGESADPESGFLHLAHAGSSILFALELFAQLEYGGKMGRKRHKEHCYFAIVKRTSKTRGVIIKRAKTYQVLWKYLEAEGVDPGLYPIRTVRPADKVGQKVPLYAPH